MNIKLQAAKILREAVVLLEVRSYNYGCTALVKANCAPGLNNCSALLVAADQYRAEADMHMRRLRRDTRLPWFWDTDSTGGCVANTGYQVDPVLARAARIQCMLDAAEVLERGTVVQVLRAVLVRQAQRIAERRPVFVCDMLRSCMSALREYSYSLREEAGVIWADQDTDNYHGCGWWPQDKQGQADRKAAVLRAIEQAYKM